MRQSDPRIIAGRRLLRILIPRAEALMKKGGYSWTPMSALGRAQAPYLRLDNIDAALIYQAPKGGWHGDLLLKEVPVGVANVLGTPVQNPCPTREMAVEVTVGLLAQIMGGTDHLLPAVALPVFLYYGVEINLISDILEQIPGYDSVEDALTRLGELERELFPGGIPDEWTLEGEPAKSLAAVAHMAAKTGVFRYPPKEDSEPSPEGPRMKTNDETN